MTVQPAELGASWIRASSMRIRVMIFTFAMYFVIGRVREENEVIRV